MLLSGYWQLTNIAEETQPKQVLKDIKKDMTNKKVLLIEEVKNWGKFLTIHCLSSFLEAKKVIA